MDSLTVNIIQQRREFELYGFSGRAADRNYSGMAFRLSERCWQTVRSMNLKNAGQNIWVYEPDHMVFAGLSLIETPSPDSPLMHKRIVLDKYAYHKHTGPYSLIPSAGQAMREYLRRRGEEILLPYIEIYGHWTKDEKRLETELIMGLR